MGFETIFISDEGFQCSIGVGSDVLSDVEIENIFWENYASLYPGHKHIKGTCFEFRRQGNFIYVDKSINTEACKYVCVYCGKTYKRNQDYLKHFHYYCDGWD